MNKNIIFCFMLTFLIIPNISHSNDDKSKVLLQQLNDVENTLSQEIKRLKGNIISLEDRLSKFSLNIAAVQTAKKDIEEKYKDILKKEAQFKYITKDIAANSLAIVEVKTHADVSRNNIVRIEGRIDSSKEIVTWVTLIVSIVVILIGAFFSKVFLELYSNYRVICAKFPDVKPEKTETDTQ